MALAMVAVGIAHFVTPDPFARIVPPAIGMPYVWVYVSGFFEVAGGLGLLVPRTRRAAAWGLIALFVAVFPANIYMATHGISPLPEQPVSTFAQWARLPFQAVFIAWAWWLAQPDGQRRTPGSTPQHPTT